MKDLNETYRIQTMLGWILILAIQAHYLIFMIIHSALDNDALAAIRADPGPRGITVVTYAVILYALMPLVVNLIHPIKFRAIRWLVVVIAVLGMLFYVMHHIGHWRHGDRPDLVSHLFDLVHHSVSLWIIYNSIRWALAPKEEAAS